MNIHCSNVMRNYPWLSMKSKVMTAKEMSATNHDGQIRSPVETHKKWLQLKGFLWSYLETGYVCLCFFVTKLVQFGLLSIQRYLWDILKRLWNVMNHTARTKFTRRELISQNDCFEMLSVWMRNNTTVCLQFVEFDTA